jgi:acetyl esterase/lipase
MSVIELTKFRVKPEHVTALLAARAGMVQAFREDRRGFIAARLVRVSDDTWLDFVEWTDDSAWDESKAKGANRPEIAEFFAAIDELVEVRGGLRYDDAEDGRRAVRTIAYGPEPSQVGELYLPEGTGPFPVVVLIHGGFWTAMYDRRQITGLADDLVANGYAVWNIEYRRIGEPGGGWPGTLLDVATAVDAVEGLDPALDSKRVFVVGHSAGGHLATWAARRAALPDDAPGAGPKVTPLGAVSLAGVLDLAAAATARLGSELGNPDADPPMGAPAPGRPEVWPSVGKMVADGVVPVFLGGRPDEVPQRYAAASPVELADGGVPVLVVHGTADDVVPTLSSRSYVDAGGDVRYVELAGANHFDMIDPAGEAWRIVRSWLRDRR